MQKHRKSRGPAEHVEAASPELWVLCCFRGNRPFFLVSPPAPGLRRRKASSRLWLSLLDITSVSLTAGNYLFWNPASAGPALPHATYTTHSHLWWNICIVVAIVLYNMSGCDSCWLSRGEVPHLTWLFCGETFIVLWPRLCTQLLISAVWYYRTEFPQNALWIPSQSYCSDNH